MNAVFISNYFNHHQAALSDELEKLTDGNFLFVETSEMDCERIAGGWAMEKPPEYVLRYGNGLSQQHIDNADIVILGDAPSSVVSSRLRDGKLTFRYCERIYKERVSPWKLPIHKMRFDREINRFHNYYLLAASAYSAADFAKTHTFIDRAFKWGYFPATREYESCEKLINNKRFGSLLWVGRLVDCKQPLLPIRILADLRKMGFDLSLTVVGRGPLETDLLYEANRLHVANSFTHIQSMTPDDVRNLMETSEVLLFTSDRREGWGAVVGEAMNSGCGVVASHAAGSVPFLIQDGVNGLVYRDGCYDELLDRAHRVVANDAFRQELALNAVRTMTEKWNAKVSARRLLSLSHWLISGRQGSPYNDGPCSIAPVIQDDWYR